MEDFINKSIMYIAKEKEYEIDKFLLVYLL